MGVEYRIKFNWRRFFYIVQLRQNSKVTKCCGMWSVDGIGHYIQKGSILLHTLICLINEQGQINEQALNSKVLPACFLFTVYVVPNKRAGRANS